MSWPTCGKCNKSILVHHLTGARAYCDTIRRAETRSTFTATEVNQVRRTLGHKLSHNARDLERREADASRTRG